MAKSKTKLILRDFETDSISELSIKLRKCGKFDWMSDKEFDDFILSRRPLELIYVAILYL